MCSKSEQMAVKEERAPAAERDKLPAILLGATSTQLPGAELGEVPEDGVRTHPELSPLCQESSASDSRGAKRSLPKEHLWVPSSKL